MDGAWVIVPATTLRTRERFEQVLEANARLRENSTFAYRAAEPSEVPGLDVPLWCFEAFGCRGSLGTLAEDLSRNARGVVVLRLFGGAGAVAVFVDGVRLARTTIEKGTAEREVTDAFSRFAGAWEAEVGWLDRWLDKQTGPWRVVRWNGGRPSSAEWPTTHATPTAEVFLDLDTEVPIATERLRSEATALVEKFHLLEAALNALAQLRSEGDASLADAKKDVEAARLAIVAVCRRALPFLADEETLAAAAARVIAERGVPAKEARRVLGKHLQ